MNRTVFPRCQSVVLWICFGLTAATSATSQTASSPLSSSVLLSQAVSAFSNGQAIHTIRITGNATWYSGQQEDAGSVVLTASDNGPAGLQLELQALGQKTESQSSVGSSAKCSWTGSDAVSHQVHASSCCMPLIWFLPAFSLQPAYLANNVNLTDFGNGSVGNATGTYRHLRLQLSTTDASDPITEDVSNQAAADLGLNPQTMLPAVLVYAMQPDNGAPISIPVQVVYSDYQLVSGINIPFVIQRYVNGQLQLAIHVNSISAN